MKNFNLGSSSSDLALVAKGKYPYRGKPWDKNKGGKFQAKQKGMTQSKFPKRNDECYYCGKSGHHSKDCYKRKYNESKQRNRRHNGNFVDKDINDGFKNLKLFVSDAALSVENDDKNACFIDSSASLHMSCNREWFDEYRENIDGTYVCLGDNRSLKVQGYGVICVNLPNGQKKQIHNVMYVPDIKKNLISVSTITDQDLKVEFVKSQCVVKDVQDQYKIIATGTKVGGLYKLDVTRKSHQGLASTTMSTVDLWHQRYGHLNHKDLLLLQKNTMVEGLPILKNDHVECEACVLGKQHREEFPLHKEKRQREILELIHTDQQFTVPHTPQQNGVAERKNRTLVECARSMLQGKNISNVFWAEAINTAVYLKNRSPTKILELKTPFEAFYGYKPKVSHLRVFGCKAFAHIPKDERRKLDAKSIKCIFIGYCDKHRAYKLFDPNTHRLLASRDVVFHEIANEGNKINNTSVWHDIDNYVKLDTDVEQEHEQAQEQIQTEEQRALSSHDTPRRGEGTPQRKKKDESSKTPRRSSRQSQVPVKYKYYALMSQIMNVVEPSSYDEAKEYEEWRNAMNEEYNSIMKNDTRELTELHKNKVPIGCKWLYKSKFNTDGSIDKHKAILVAKRYSQKKGIDYEDTFAPVANLSTIRIMIALTTKYNWKMHQLDVKSAFLNGELKEEVYLVQLEGFVKQGQEHLVCRLKKDLYGLKQAPRSWHVKIDSFFYEKGFMRSKNDPNLYIKKDEDKNVALISVYVDDLIITGNACKLIEEIKNQLSHVFEMKDLGELHYFLGLEVWREPGKTLIT
eukprot:PITA_19494